MARFLFAWELGGGLGHTMPLAAVARELLKLGHDVDLVLKDLTTAASAVGDLADHPRMRAWGAPVWLHKLAGAQGAMSYAELLFTGGYLDANGIYWLTRGWRHLFEAIRPDVLVVDHAPTALLAARGLQVPKVHIGTGFFIPPLHTPLPGPFDTAVSKQRLDASEARVLSTCNSVLGRMSLPPLACLSELIETDQTYLLGWPELDFYPGRGAANNLFFVGPLGDGVQGALPTWRSDQGQPGCFAYLKGNDQRFESLMACLTRCPASFLVYAPDINAQQLSKWQGANLVTVREPVNLALAGRDADAIVCHAGAGTIYSALSQGVPVLMLPTQAEQQMTAQRVQRLGCGLNVDPAAPIEQIEGALHRLLTDDRFKVAAQHFASKRSGKVGSAATEIANGLSKLLAY